jgi:predicted PurR-regulated permease PerM
MPVAHARHHRSKLPLVPLVVTLAALYFIKGVFVPLAFAILLSFLLVPVVDALQRLRLPRPAAAAITVLLACGVVGGTGWLLATELLDLASSLPAYSARIHQKFENSQHKSPNLIWRALEGFNNIQREWAPHEDTTSSSGGVRRGSDGRRAKNTEPTPVTVLQPPMSNFDALRAVVVPFLQPLAQAGITIIFACYLLVRREDVRNRLLRLAGVSQLNIATRALDDAAHRVSRYLRTQLIVNLCFGTIVAVVLFFLNIPNSGLWGFVAGLFRFVPYAGWIAASAGPAILSLATSNHIILPIGILAFYLVLEAIVANLIEPWLYGSHTGISPLGLLVAAVFWSVLWGPVGLILSTPLTVCVVVLGRYVPRFSFLHILLADEPMLTPETRVYQRLLAMDSNEVKQLVTAARKEATLADVYDQLLISALLMAEQDIRRGDIDTKHETFILHTLEDLVKELAETPDEEEGVEDDTKPAPPQAPSPAGRKRVVLVPCSGEADAIAASMMGALLDREGISSIQVAPGGLSRLRSSTRDLFCVVALAPFGLKHAAVVSSRVRMFFRDAPLFVTVLGYGDSMRVSAERFTKLDISELATSIPSALESLTQHAVVGYSAEMYSEIPGATLQSEKQG